MNDELLAIKGIREGLLFTIKANESWPTITRRIAARIDEKRAFFKGARVALDVGERPVVQAELDSVKNLMMLRQMSLWAVISSSETTRSAAAKLGLEISLVQTQEQLDAPEIDPEEEGDAGVVIAHTLRSGRTVRTRGSVTIIGDVNPGAEIVSDGSVVVWGRLRGTVHAGASGDETAIICALDLAPVQLRIASLIAVAPDKKRRKVQPEICSIQGGRIIAEGWE